MNDATQTDSLMMRAIIPNPERNLIDGQFVTAIIQERKEEPRLVVPQSALQVDQSGYYVLVVTDQHKVEQRRVQTGPNLGTDIVVTSALSFVQSHPRPGCTYGRVRPQVLGRTRP